MKSRLQSIWLPVAIATGVGLCPELAEGQDIGRILQETRPGADARVDLPSGQAAPVEGGDEILFEELRGIDLDGDIEVPGFSVLRAELDTRVGRPLTTAGLVELLDLVVAHYESEGYPVVEVFVPEQEISDGRILIEVVEGKVGVVAVGGGQHLRPPVWGIAPGDTLTMGGLQGELDWLNRNRFYEGRLVVAPGEGLAEADLLFQLSDGRPLRVFGGFENSGVEIVGEERFFAGLEWGNAFGLGHRLMYQATLGTDVDDFNAHALDYRVPLPWRHELGFLAAIVNTEAVLEDGTDNGGTSWLLGPSYTVPLRRRGDLRHEASLGFDLKSTDNNLEFGGVQVFASTAEVAQFIGRYSAALERPDHSTSFLGEAIYSPGDLTGRNSDEAFRGIRANAVSQYPILRAQLRHVHRLPLDASLVVRAGAQWTDAPLLPSEQLAIGGYDRVRGYPERDALGDRGYWGSAELRTPGLVGGDLQFLGFIDYGRTELDGTELDRELVSAGPGLRFRLGEHASARFDYGWQLDGGGSRGHFSLQVEF